MIDPNEKDPYKLRKEIEELQRDKLEQYNKAGKWQILFWVLILILFVLFCIWLHGGCSGPSDISGT